MISICSLMRLDRIGSDRIGYFVCLDAHCKVRDVVRFDVFLCAIDDGFLTMAFDDGFFPENLFVLVWCRKGRALAAFSHIHRISVFF